MSIHASSLSPRIGDLVRLHRLLSDISRKRTLNTSRLCEIRWAGGWDDSSLEKRKLLIEAESLKDNFLVLTRVKFSKLVEFVTDYDDLAVEQLASALSIDPRQRIAYVERLAKLRADISGSN
jgi:hypothetical protein